MLTRLQAFLGALPVGLEWAIATALHRRPPRGAVERSASPVIPIVCGVLLVLAIVPLVFAGLDLIIHRSTAKELVDRVTGPSLQLIEVSGLVELPPIPAPPLEDDAPEAEPMRYYFLRDAADARDVVVIRSALAPRDLTTREVTGVVVEDPERVAFDAAALAERGAEVNPATFGGRYLRETRDGSGGTQIAATELGAHEPGTVVHLRVRFDSHSVAGCGSRGDDPCDARTLAGGTAHFDLLAYDAETGAPLLVRSDHPASLAPMQVFGTQETDRDPLDDLFATRAGAIMGTWGRELRVAWIDRDPGLPVNRPWWAPALLIGFALLLMAGRRIGYPVFRATDDSASVAGLPARPVAFVASGRLSRPTGGPIDIDRLPGRLAPGSSAITVELEVDAPDGAIRSTISRSLREVSAVQPGELVHLDSREPALELHWFGSDLMLAFESDDDRDAVAALLRR